MIIKNNKNKKQEEKKMVKFTALSSKGLPIVTNAVTLNKFSDLVLNILAENGEKISYSYLRTCIGNETKGKSNKFRGFSNLLPAHFQELGFTVVSEKNTTYITL